MSLAMPYYFVPLISEEYVLDCLLVSCRCGVASAPSSGACCISYKVRCRSDDVEVYRHEDLSSGGTLYVSRQGDMEGMELLGL